MTHTCMHDIYYDGLIMYVRTYMSCMYFVRMYDVLILYIIYSTIIQHESKLTPTLFSLSQSPPSPPERIPAVSATAPSNAAAMPPFSHLRRPTQQTAKGFPPPKESQPGFSAVTMLAREPFFARTARTARAQGRANSPLSPNKTTRRPNHPKRQPPDGANRQPPPPPWDTSSLWKRATVPKRSTSNSAPPKPSLPWRAAR